MKEKVELTTLYDTETCWRHSREYPAWLMRCPDCEAEQMRKQQAAHYSRQRWDRYANLDTDTEERPLTPEETMNWDRWAAQALITVLSLVLVIGLWMMAQNRQMHSEQVRQAQEAGR